MPLLHAPRGSQVVYKDVVRERERVRALVASSFQILAKTAAILSLVQKTAARILARASNRNDENGTIPDGISSREEQMDAIKRLTSAPRFAHPLSRDQKKTIAAHRAKADRWAESEEGLALLRAARDPEAKLLEPEGEKMNPEEVAAAMGARIVGRGAKKTK